MGNLIDKYIFFPMNLVKTHLYNKKKMKPKTVEMKEQFYRQLYGSRNMLRIWE